MIAFAGYEDTQPAPLAPGGIRWGTLVPASYQSDYRPSMDWRSAPLQRPGVSGYGGTAGILDDWFADAKTAATTTVSQSIVEQVPAIVAAVVASPGYQSEMTKIRAQAVIGGIVLGALVVAGVVALGK